MPTAEHQRLDHILNDAHSWRLWGPYLSERAWATVREDYSADGNAWAHMPHDLARSKAFRWGEDGIAGICDRYQVLCFAPVFWNQRDAILKERLFGVTPAEGNHGEDVKEYYFHLDNLPSHAYMKYLYKYPHAAYPYEELVAENQRRCGQGMEFELLDAGVFQDDRYFDIFIEYAKNTPDDLCIRITAHNRGPDPAPLHILPQLWFRNTWAWSGQPGAEPSIRPGPPGEKWLSLLAQDEGMETLATIPGEYHLGPRYLYGPAGGTLLFTGNETNGTRVFGPGHENRRPFVKDAFHRQVVNGENACNPAQVGTKAALHYVFPTVPAGGSVVLRLRLCEPVYADDPLALVDEVCAQRLQEADEFFATIHPPEATADENLVQRQAIAGLLWNKQNYLFDVDTWLDGDFPGMPPPADRLRGRNVHWRHLNSLRVMTMPDKWEYPWFAAWDLAFHAIVFGLIDGAFAKEQLWNLLFEQFQHPNGQIPAYEWEYSDLNPPVHAWAVWRVYNMERYRDKKPDRDFLEKCFHKLLINFAWWINKVDREGNNIFEGGFLGLDNITVVDRSQRHEYGATLEQADATGWMGMFCLNMMRIALELALENKVYENAAVKFFQHYAYVAHAMKHMGNRDYQLWDDQDGFFYDVLRYPDGRSRKFRVRSLVGLIPLFAAERLEADWLKPFPEFNKCLEWFLKNRRDLVQDVVHTIEQDGQTTYALTIVNQDQMRRLFERVFDPKEFLSDYGVRSLSKAHQEQPFVYEDKVVGYEPAEAVCKIKGGNSNWRGPIWFPTCFLLIESLRKLAKAFGDQFVFELACQDGRRTTLLDLARDLSNRMIAIFTRDAKGRRPVFGGSAKFQSDPHWRDHVLFYEYFHGDDGAGLGASHQTGWTALVASLIDEWRRPGPF